MKTNFSCSFKKTSSFFILTLTLITIGTNAQNKTRRPNAIKVVVDRNYAPYSFQSNEGKLHGILIDQWHAWEKKTGIKVNISAADWGEALVRMRAGEFDVIDCIVETAEREKYFDFTSAYTSVEASIYFRKDISGITDLPSLKGFPVGVKKGDQHIEKLKSNGVTTLIEFENNDAIIKAASEQKINVFLSDNPSALYLLHKLGIESEFRHSAPVFKDKLRRAVRKGDIALLNTVSNGFAAIEPNELKQIDERWFGQAINNGRYVTFLGYGAAVAILLMIILVVWNRTLRKAVLLRTEALRKSEDRIRLIIDTIPIMAWTVQPDSIIDFANQRWLDYSGFSLSEIGDSIRVIHPEDQPRVMERWRASMAAREPSEDEMRLQRADGEYRWFMVRTAPLYDEDGNLVKWYGVSIDIEDSKQAEDKLQLAYQRLSYHVENTPLAVIEFDKDLHVKRWSKRAEEIFGWNTSEALGKNVYDSDFRIIYKEDLPAVDTINEELTKGVVNWNLSLNRNYTKDGSVIYCEWYNSVLKDERGKVITILSLVLNVTQRKRTEEKLQQVNTELHKLSTHLQNIQENERITIAREIHDELGQQLTGLKMQVGWLSRKLPDEPMLRDKGNEIMSMVSDLLKTVRRIAMNLRPNILDQLGLIAALEWQGQEFEKSTNVKFDFRTNLNEFDADKNLSINVFRVHQEALTNIARHAEASSVETTLEKKDGWLLLTISDNGMGFDVDEENSGDFFGLIGMRERSLMLHGELVIESAKQKGTVIKLKVPLLK